jgi:transcriptional regulator with XRE-family HTH domain
MNFGERLRQVRTKHDLTQDEVAAALQVTKGSISAWETGRNHPLYEQIIALCNLFRCNPDDLMAGELRHNTSYGVRESAEPYDTKRAQQARERALLVHFRAMSPKLQDSLLDLLTRK